MIGFDLPPPSALGLHGVASLPRVTVCALMDMFLSGEIFDVLVQLEEAKAARPRQPPAPHPDNPLAGHTHIHNNSPRLIISADAPVLAIEADNFNQAPPGAPIPHAPPPMFTVVRSFGGVEITEGIPFLEFERTEKVAALRRFLPSLANGDVTIGLGYNLGPIEALMLGNHPQFLDS
jgi:hypothetical protein